MGPISYVLLHSDPTVLLLKPLHERRNGIEGRGAEGRGRLDGRLRRHVVFAPLEVPARFCGVRERR